jgi:phospho-N-acetylmuramoyl-pentapeptide-transferase
VIFIPVVILLSAVSNGANLTDGIDGLAGTSAISVLALGFYFRLRKYYFLNYLNIMYIPNSGE